MDAAVQAAKRDADAARAESPIAGPTDAAAGRADEWPGPRLGQGSECMACRVTGGAALTFIGGTALHEAYLLGTLTRDMPRRRPVWGAALSLGGAALLTAGVARLTGVWSWAPAPALDEA